MDGSMMDYPLTITAMLRRTEAMFGHKEIVSRRADRSLERSNYAWALGRARRLASALERLGVGRGDRVATLCWNHLRHLEAYFGVPSSGAVLHTLNLRLHIDELTYIATHAGDSVLLADYALVPLAEQLRQRVSFKHVIVVRDDEASEIPAGMIDYETLLASGDPSYQYPELAESEAAMMCYTSGTTGRPKGVLYSHRSLCLHTLGTLISDVTGITERDSVLAVVPMFHANAWGMPFTAAVSGARQVMPGPHLDAASLVDLFERERVTMSAGVPTIWLGILQYLDANPSKHDLSCLKRMLVGGAAVPEPLIRAFQDRHGLHIQQGWGMTETSPVASVSKVPSDLEDASSDVKFAYRAKAGIPLPFVEIRARRDDGALAAWDGDTMGELEVRGPWVAQSYYNAPESADRFTEDGWFRTGDIVTIDARGCITIQDRAKDLVKSGGEWISSVALEGALLSHPDITEAVVIALPHAKWDERPVAVVVPRAGRTPSLESVRSHLAPSFAKWWLPDDVILVESIPRSGTGKYLKNVLRERFRGHLSATSIPRAGLVDSSEGA
ncbi:MAG TPA: long-chain fatty acid--CoA ligase [Gemmatimonadaceae bacterium]|nr:long-chain fatty acid--CoA ligase [Gemmatimonadaceae bacterium]